MRRSYCSHCGRKITSGEDSLPKKITLSSSTSGVENKIEFFRYDGVNGFAKYEGPFNFLLTLYDEGNGLYSAIFDTGIMGAKSYKSGRVNSISDAIFRAISKTRVIVSFSITID